MRRFVWGLLPFLASVVLFAPQYVLAQACVDGVSDADVRQMDIIGAKDPGASNPLAWTCQSASDQSQRDKCVASSKCSNGGLCCPPATGGKINAAQPTATQAQPRSNAGGFLSAVTPVCYSEGDCTLDDIIRTAVLFVNFLFGISGAVLLLIFVYAGWLYLVGGVSPDGIAQAKKMLTGSVIGIIIMFGAHTLIRFFVGAFLGR